MTTYSSLFKRRRTYKPYVNFHATDAWQSIRVKVLEKYGSTCLCCGSKNHINVDHIKPRSSYPELALDFDNLQVLCAGCNLAKGWKDETDYRPKAQEQKV